MGSIDALGNQMDSVDVRAGVKTVKFEKLVEICDWQSLKNMLRESEFCVPIGACCGYGMDLCLKQNWIPVKREADPHVQSHVDYPWEAGAKYDERSGVWYHDGFQSYLCARIRFKNIEQKAPWVYAQHLTMQIVGAKLKENSPLKLTAAMDIEQWIEQWIENRSPDWLQDFWVGKEHGFEEFERYDCLREMASFVIKISCEFKLSETSRKRSRTYELSSDLCRAFKNPKTTDAVIRLVDNDKKTVFEKACHSAVLAARSEVFERMFCSRMQESTTKVIEIPDTDATEVALCEFLHFLYADELESDNHECETLEAILILADKYAVSSLVTVVSELVIAKLSVQNFARILAMGNFLNCDHLKKAAVSFYNRDKSTKQAIKKSAGFTGLGSDLLELLD